MATTTSAPVLGTLVTYNPWTVSPETLLQDVAARFEELDIHHVVVVDEQRRVVGILSETDLLRASQSRRAALVNSAGELEEPPAVFVHSAMSRDVVSVPPSASRADCLAILLRRRIHALPVTDDGRLVGLITSRDVLREFSYGEAPSARRSLTAVLDQPLPAPLAPGTSLDDALLAMHEAGVGCLAVAQEGRPLGILSQREIVRAKCRLDEDATAAGETTIIPTAIHVARRSPLLLPTQRLNEAAAAMIDQDLPAVLVADPDGRWLGLVTEDDLLQALYEDEA